jgi:uncharacterized membrane protein YozB (DUF420 family)
VSGASRPFIVVVSIVVSAAVVGAAVLGLLLSRPPSGSAPERLRALPTFNAVMNGTSGVLLVAGYALIRKKKIRAHLTVMLLALVAGTLFLTSYVYYHAHAGSVRFQGEGWIRPVYFSVLISHTLLAALVPPLAVVVVYRAARRQFDRHRRIARVTLPIWLYVSATGVLIYLMLYVWFPGSPP